MVLQILRTKKSVLDHIYELKTVHPNCYSVIAKFVEHVLCSNTIMGTKDTKKIQRYNLCSRTIIIREKRFINNLQCDTL